jgi:hypothetical protein
MNKNNRLVLNKREAFLYGMKPGISPNYRLNGIHCLEFIADGPACFVIFRRQYQYNMNVFIGFQKCMQGIPEYGFVVY